VVDGKDHRDHLTANVVLPLKENGVYTVHGIERERKKSEPKTLVWKFEYTVEDKRVPQTGQPLAGEKVVYMCMLLSLLTFCFAALAANFVYLLS